MPDTTVSTATTNFDKALTVLVIRVLEEELRGTLPHVRECIPAQFLAGSTGTMRYLRIGDMDVVAGTPTPGVAPWLTEGVTPDGEDADIGYEEFSCSQAGRLLKLTDKSVKRWSGDLTATATERVSRNAAATADKRVSNVILAGTSVLYADASNPSTNNSSDDIVAADIVTGKLLRRAGASLKGDDVPVFADQYLHSIIHPDVVFDIQGDDAVGGWLDANKYAGTLALMTGEIGKYAGIRFIESSNAGVKVGAGSGSIDVYSTVIYGPNAFVFGDWGTIEVFYTAPGGKGDELHQRSAVGWKGEYGAMIVGEGANATNVEVPRYVRIESASGL